MNVCDAIATVLDFVVEWNYDDNPRSRNVCGSCGWDSWESTERGLNHLPGCRLRASLNILEELIKSPDMLIIKGWFCKCGIFNGEEKERLNNCRCCSQERP